MVRRQVAPGIIVGGMALIVLQYVFRFAITFAVIRGMSPGEYRWRKISNGIFDWDD